MKKLLLRTVQIGSPRQAKEGLRIGAVRFLPRGIRKEEYGTADYFDVWLPTLAPSRELFAKLKDKSISISRFLARYRTEMAKTEPHQVIQLLAELSTRTPISIGCYCSDESLCHRSVLGKLIREAAGEFDSPLPLYEFSIYTIVHPDKLNEALAIGGSHTWTEAKPWAEGQRLLTAALRSGAAMPILFGDATDCSRMTHWATLQNIRSKNDETLYQFESLRRLEDLHSPQELTLRSTGNKIASGFIRPYAICKTPKFLDK